MANKNRKEKKNKSGFALFKAALKRIIKGLEFKNP